MKKVKLREVKVVGMGMIEERTQTKSRAKCGCRKFESGYKIKAEKKFESECEKEQNLIAKHRSTSV